MDFALKETIQFNLHNNTVIVITTSNMGKLSLREFKLLSQGRQ